MQTYPATATTQVSIDVPSARVDVTAVSSEQVSVNVAPAHAWRLADRRAAERIEVHAGEDRITISSPQRSFGDLGSAIVFVTVPASTDVDVRTGNGAIRLMGPLGAARTHTANGAIHVEESQSLEASTSNGAVRVDVCHGQADLKATSGSLKLGGAGSAALRTASGSIKIAGATGQVRASSSNGSIAVERADGEVSLESRNGAVRVGSALGGRLDVQAANGKISVGVPEKVSAWVDASTRHGRVDNRLTPGPGPSSEHTVELHLHSNAGSIVLDRPEHVTP
jgi:DUF4097 and DUF4098 domain-containing protein YvlB